ncbi:hypothetical protein SARC_11267 [Sphaeroforma arctica JP610]|uniref:Uncharacterized protein n=1 Tax=Sphaeroforma arctica JP610 TaxID=667725 RepID=A0A0L0FHH4_9EUKA|nr:hypothetical protein SARC_11267 [Sphaeroforma arctica JP610]KNC76227.1 hypothetical protein SARC_11267 [Sphaeroforma arctica JP610]|eukprot:XP_014150129.1 hypothetical protein SARC_11267 [Sphaeroforma arctica JP610]
MGGLFCSSGTPFHRMRLLIGGQTVEDIYSYNQLCNTLFRTTAPKDLADSFAGEELGFYGSAAGSYYTPRFTPDESGNGKRMELLNFSDNSVLEYTVTEGQRDNTLIAGDLINELNENFEDASTIKMAAIWPEGEDKGYFSDTIKDRRIFNCYKSRQILDAKHGREYYHTPMMGLLNNQRYLPLSHLGEVVLEITLDQASTVLKAYKPKNPALFSDAGLPGPDPGYHNQAITNGVFTPVASYTLEDFAYHIDILQMDDSYLMAFEASLAERSIHIPYVTSTHYSFPLTQRNDLMLQHRSRNVKSLLLLPQVVGLANSIEHNSFMSAGSLALQEVQVRIGAYQKPLQPITTATGNLGGLNEPVSSVKLSRAWCETMKALSLFGDVNYAPAIDINMYRYGSFVLGLDFEREGGASSGIDTASESTPIVLSVQCNHPLVGNQKKYGGVTLGNIQLNCYVIHSNTLIMSGAHEVAVFT